MVNSRHKEISARVKHMNGSTIKYEIDGKYQLDDKRKAQVRVSMKNIRREAVARRTIGQTASANILERNRNNRSVRSGAQGRSPLFKLSGGTGLRRPNR